jgi:hypothetical protein
MVDLVTGSSGVLGHCVVTRLHERDGASADVLPPTADIAGFGEAVRRTCATPPRSAPPPAAST